MKVLYLFLFIMFSLNIKSQTNKYIIRISNNSQTTAVKFYVAYSYGGNEYIDSFNLTGAKTVFSKKIGQPVAALIYTNQKTIPGKKVFLSDAPVTVVIRNNEIEIKYYPLKLAFEKLIINDEIRPTYFPLYGELSARNDTVGLNKISILFDSLKQDDITKAYRYFKSNNQSALVLFAFQRYSSFKADYSIIENDYLTLPLWVRNTSDGKLIAEKIAGVKNGALGKAAIDFSQQSSLGNIIQFSSFKGNYILLDFWASWCVPCRKEHPGFLSLYTAYKSKNFEIISISLDNNKNAWLNAILKDEMKWINLSDLKGQQNEVAVKYGIQAIPANFLIDPNGIIIAKNLTAYELSIQLNKLIK